jgi:predicted TIM-barrel fold metal-dependent hydrolase
MKQFIVQTTFRIWLAVCPTCLCHRSPHLPGDPRWEEGMAVMEKLGLVYDIGCSHEGLAEVLACAKAFPNVTMVLNHCGGTPGPEAFDGHPEIEQQWKEGMRDLASCPNMCACRSLTLTDHLALSAGYRSRIQKFPRIVRRNDLPSCS